MRIQQLFSRRPRLRLTLSSNESDHSDLESQNPECEHLLRNTDSSVEEECQVEVSTPLMAASGHDNSERELHVELPPPKPDIYAPPPYEEVETAYSVPCDMPITASSTRPPSYEEVQRQKAIEAGHEYPLPPPPMHEGNPSDMQVVRISSLAGLDPQTAEIAEEQLLGTDLMFFVAFTAAFVFNWIGFVLLLCFCHTVAGRTGALAGFGLSLAKWAVIVRHSTDLVADNNTWLLWLIMVLGLLICVRAILQYVSAKRDWQQLPHNSRHRFFLFY